MDEDMSYSTKKVSQELIDEIKNALHSVDYGSIEIIVTNRVVTQISKRNIKKTSIHLEEEEVSGSIKKKLQITKIKKLSIDN